VLEKAYRSEDAPVRREILWALGRIGPGDASGALIDLLVQAVRDPDQGVREQAALALGQVGSAARTALPHLLRR
jgi:HEAT repeat protein